MVEDIGLNSFIFVPYLVCQEKIHFYWQTELRRLTLGHYKIQILCNKRMGTKISFNIDPI